VRDGTAVPLRDDATPVDNDDREGGRERSTVVEGGAQQRFEIDAYR
jgi:hypothetical protein